MSLLGIVALYLAGGEGANLNMIELAAHLAENPISPESQKTIFGLLLFGLGVLVSLFPTYSWAPRGYGSAPTSNAMLHAGVLKKFGIYGLIQVAAPLLPEGASSWSATLTWLALGNVVLIGFVVFGSARPKADDRLRLGDAHGLLFLRVGHTIRHRYRRRCATDGRSWHVGRTTLSPS